MKRAVTAAVVAVMALALSACGETPADRCAKDPDVIYLAENMELTPSQTCIGLLKEDPVMFDIYWGK